MNTHKIFNLVMAFVFAFSLLGMPSTNAKAQTLNESPVITEGDSISITMSQNGYPTPFVLTLHATDADAGDTLTWFYPPPSPSHGMVSVGSSTGEVSYVPETDYVGQDTFYISVQDNNSGVDVIEVNVTVEPVQEPVPTFAAHLSASGIKNVTAVGWPVGANLTLTIDDLTTGESPDYTETKLMPDNDLYGQNWVDFELDGFDLHPGQFMVITDGTTTKTHTVGIVTVSTVDLNTDTITGTAEPNTVVGINAHYDPGGDYVHRNITTDANGDWTVNLSIPGPNPGEESTYDITTGSWGTAFQWDEDNDSTFFAWQIVEPPNFHVRPAQNEIHAFRWPEGNLVHVTVDDPSTPNPVDYEETQEAVMTEWFNDMTFIIFRVQGMTLQPGQIVTMTDGITTRTHIIEAIAVTNIDTENDIVEGTAAPGTLIHIWQDKCDPCAQRYPTADGSGHWIADFKSLQNPGDDLILDIQPGTRGSANIRDDDGDFTTLDWYVLNPYFDVRANNDQVEAWDWETGANLTLNIYASGTETPPANYTDTKTVTGPAPWGDPRNYVSFDLNGAFDILPGYLVTVSDGTITKRHIVTNLAFTNINVDTDMVYGMAEPNQIVNIWTCWQNNPCVNRDETADQNGNWTTNFSIAGEQEWEQQTADLQSGSWIDSSVGDEDGDSTMYGENVIAPVFMLNINNDSSWRELIAWNWPLGSEVTLTVDDPGTPENPDYTEVRTMGARDGSRPTGASYLQENQFDGQPGFIITLSDGIQTRTMIVPLLQGTSYDLDADTVAGVTDPLSHVVVACDSGAEPTVIADDEGNWLADLGALGYDVRPGTWCEPQMYDEDGDHIVLRDWRVPNPFFMERTNTDQIEVVDWPMSATLTIDIDNPTTPLNPDYSTEVTVSNTAPWDSNSTYASIDLSGVFDIQSGFTMTVHDDVTTKTLLVSNLAFTDIDFVNEIVTGVASPNARVDIRTGCDDSGNCSANRHVNADGNGNWMADFNTLGVQDDEQNTYDIVIGSWVDSSETDEDGDSTMYGVSAELPQCLIGDSVSGHVYGPGGSDPLEKALVVIEDAATHKELYGVQTNASGYYTCGLPDGNYHVKAYVPNIYSVVFYDETYPDTASEIIVPDNAPLIANLTLDNPIFTFDNLIFNMEDPIVGDLAIRQAIAHGTDRGKMIAVTFPSAPLLNTFEPERYWAYAASGLPVYGYDPDQARQILTDAGWVDTNNDGIRENPNGDPLTITLLTSQLYNNGHPRSRQIPIFVKNMADIGIQIVVDNNCCGNLDATYGLVLVGWGFMDLNADAGRPGSFAAGYKTGNMDTNWGHYSNPDVDNWIDLAEAGTTRAEKLPYLQNVQVQVMNDLAILPISERIGDMIQMPNFQVRANTDQVEAFRWTMGDQLFLEIDNPTTTEDPDYIASQTVTGTAPWDPSQTYVSFDLYGEHDIQIGDQITITNGSITRSTIVANLAFTNIDLDNDKVYGVAEPNQIVNIWTCWQNDPCVNRDETADQNGNWVTNFAVPGEQDWEQGTMDLRLGSWIDSSVGDDGGDQTMFGQNVPNYTLHVNLKGNEVHGHDWPGSSMVTLTIDNDTDPTNGVLYTETKLANEDTSCGEPCFNLQDLHTLQRGQIVTMSDEDITKTVRISSLQITEVNAQDDTVSGLADPGTNVKVKINSQNGNARFVVADEDGKWKVDFKFAGDANNPSTNIGPSDNGAAIQLNANDNEDGTLEYWSIANPNIRAVTNQDRVDGWDWAADATATLTIDDPGTQLNPDFTTQGTVGFEEGDGRTYINIEFGKEYDLKPGDVVTLTDGSTTKTVTATNVTVTNVDVDTNVASGTAESGSDVWSAACQNGNCFQHTTIADTSGNWSIDFDEEMPGQPTVDILPGGSVDGEQFDDDGDSTLFIFDVPYAPYIQANVSLSEKLVWAPWWPMGDTLTLHIYDQQGNLIYNPPPEKVVQAFFTDQMDYPMAIFYYGDDFTMQSGYHVVVSDGTMTTDVVVSELNTVEVNVDMDQITGKAAPGSHVYVDARLDGIDERHVMADENGNWLVDFSVPGDENFEQETLDITSTTILDIHQYDGTNKTYFVLPIPEIRGTVTLDGQPLEGVEVWLYGPKWDYENYAWYQCTDANGRFVFQKLPPGSNGGFLSATGPAVSLPCSNPEFLDADGKPLLMQFWDHVNGIQSPIPFDMNFNTQPYHELQYEVVRAQAYNPFLVQVHVIDLANSGACPGGAATCDLPLDNVLLKAYDRNNNNAWVASWSSGWNPWPNGGGQLRYQTLSDYTVEATYDISENGGQQVISLPLNADAFADRGDGVYVGPLVTFNFIKIINTDGTIEVYADSDSDNDGQPDLLDPCPGDETNTCNESGSASNVITSDGGTLATEDNMVNINVPANALNNTLTLNITDMGGGYEVATYEGTMSVFQSYSIQPHGTHFNEPITITFRWNDDDNNGVVDGTDFLESHILLIKDGMIITPSCAVNPNCSMGNNTLTVEVTDLSLFELSVPSNEPPQITSLVAPLNPMQIGQTITATITFNDPNAADTFTALWDWGDGTTATLPASPTTASASHTYSTPGVYTVTATITDAAGESDTETFQYVVIYDPNGGFVTGGGWINSPAGAYTLDPTLTGKATFGFVSKYQKGANVPTGNTEFQFKIANLNFKSTSYDWLVIAGSKAQYKGTGTINGAGNYGFMLTATDGTPDKFRIKIWDKATGQVVYDNMLGAVDNANPSTMIEGGSIVVHK